MKRMILALVAFIILANVQAQDVHFGLKAGLNAASLIKKGQGETEFKLGAHGGGLAHIHLLDFLALQPELFLSMQGGKTIINNTDYDTNLNYLNLPVLLQYMFDNGFRLQAGPQFGFLLSANQEVNESKNNLIQNYRTIDFSIPLGVSYLHASGLGIDARWAFGITNINDAGNRLPVTRNSVGQIGIFYLLNYGPANHH